MARCARAAPVRLHRNLADLYRQKVTELHAVLEDPELRREAVDLIRGLIERVEFFPAEDGFQIELVGEIANMVRLSAGPQSLGSTVERTSVKVVAGARNHLDLLLQTTLNSPV